MGRRRARTGRPREDPLPIVPLNVRPLPGAVTKFCRVKLKLSVVVSEWMELAEQERIKALLQVPGVLFVNDDAAVGGFR